MRRPTQAPTTIAIATLCWLFLIALFALNRLTPLFADDFHFNFIYAPDHLRNMPGYGWAGFYVDLFAGVSRFVPHLAVAFFSLVAGKGVFDFVSVAGFALLCLLIGRTAARGRRQVLPLAAIAGAVMWFAMPGFFQGVMWMSGACNYLLSALLTIAYYQSFTSHGNTRIPWPACAASFAFGFITGWTNEGYVVGLAAGCTLYALLHRDEMRNRRLWLYIGLLCGAVPLCLSPFNVDRFLQGHSGGASNAAADAARSLIALTDIHITFLLALAALCTMAFARKRGCSIAAFVRDNVILLTALTVSLMFVVLSRHTSPHSRFPMETYSLVLLMSLAARLPLRTLQPTAIVLTAAMLATIAGLLPKAAANMNAYESMRTQILDDDVPCIVLDDVALNDFDKRFIKHVSYLPWSHNPVENGYYIVDYYGGRPGRPMIPRYVAEHLYDAPLWQAVNIPSWGMRWMRIPDGTDVQSVQMLLAPARLHVWQRPFARFFSSMTLDEAAPPGFRTLVVPGGDGSATWLAVYDNTAVASRIAGLRIVIHPQSSR